MLGRTVCQMVNTAFMNGQKIVVVVAIDGGIGQ
jgi:hypothetical protein